MTTKGARRLLLASSFLVGALLSSQSALADEPDEARCALERAVGVSAEEAQAVEAVLCDFVRAAPEARDHARVSIVKMGSKYVLGLHYRLAGASIDRQLVLASLDEVTIAAPRLLEAVADSKPVEETVDVTNVVGEEARIPKKKPATIHGSLGIIAASAYGVGSGGGVDFTIAAGSETLAFVATLRLAGEAFIKPASVAGAVFTLGAIEIDDEADMSLVGVGGGIRHHFSKSDVAPFVGAGIGLDYIGRGTQKGDTKSARKGTTGMIAYGELGLDVLRTRAIGGSIVLRADAPSFTIESNEVDANDPSRRVRTSSWVPVLSAGIALRF